uniref:UDP-N-acetylglucosamine--dolichyl-phosphate N-acetylglucosaminephosphotransferase n=1 Tax=Anopheles melas TaxID=34690 RepID=A0A182U2W6_9DIPT
MPLFHRFEFDVLGHTVSLPVPLLVNVAISCGAYYAGRSLIPKMKPMFINANLYGIDMNKTSKPKIPEAFGVVTGCIFLVSLFLFIPVPFLRNFSATIQGDFPHDKFVEFIAAMLSICCMILLGFADDVLNLRWRDKLYLPTVASLPLLMVYYTNFNSTTVILPKMVRPLLGHSLDIGALYYVFMGMLAVFCTNAINILAGINGLEVCQSLIIAGSIVLFNVLEILHGNHSEAHEFSLYIMLPYIGATLALWRYNRGGVRDLGGWVVLRTTTGYRIVTGTPTNTQNLAKVIIVREIIVPAGKQIHHNVIKPPAVVPHILRLVVLIRSVAQPFERPLAILQILARRNQLLHVLVVQHLGALRIGQDDGCCVHRAARRSLLRRPVLVVLHDRAGLVAAPTVPTAKVVQIADQHHRLLDRQQPIRIGPVHLAQRADLHGATPYHRTVARMLPEKAVHIVLEAKPYRLGPVVVPAKVRDRLPVQYLIRPTDQHEIVRPDRTLGGVLEQLAEHVPPAARCIRHDQQSVAQRAQKVRPIDVVRDGSGIRGRSRCARAGPITQHKQGDLIGQLHQLYFQHLRADERARHDVVQIACDLPWCGRLIAGWNLRRDKRTPYHLRLATVGSVPLWVAATPPNTIISNGYYAVAIVVCRVLRIPVSIGSVSLLPVRLLVAPAAPTNAPPCVPSMKHNRRLRFPCQSV